MSLLLIFLFFSLAFWQSYWFKQFSFDFNCDWDTNFVFSFSFTDRLFWSKFYASFVCKLKQKEKLKTVNKNQIDLERKKIQEQTSKWKAKQQKHKSVRQKKVMCDDKIWIMLVTEAIVQSRWVARKLKNQDSDLGDTFSLVFWNFF